ncbi:MAG: hypothetical protein A2Y14_02315 [Verrucomicrobia bacterium GWF2_51_19]|nr:MAG: hypothetical protein A2Y14_02315 [Verrucomicrobia bacterium GWF2_51_19]HCJ11910.1 ABC transporter ATP-binding protein [Opitutae bacterium]
MLDFLKKQTNHSEYSIEAHQLTKYYGDFLALSDISFAIKKGEVVGFLGPNGAGKSTTMRILSGLLPATSGRAYVAGLSVAQSADQVKRKIGYMPENNPLPEDMRVLEYLHFRARLKEVADVDKHVDGVMELCDLHRKAKKRVIRTLSKGYRQRVGIADALLGEPEIILLDEPTIGLDPHQVLSIRNLISSLQGKMTVVISSHILTEIEHSCSRVIIINHGHIVADGATEALKSTVQSIHYHLQLKADMQAFEKLIAEWEGVSIVSQSTPDADTYIRLVLETPNDLHLGERLFDLVKTNDWHLRELSRVDPSLEDVFLAATKRSWEQSTGAPFKQ